MEVKNHVILFLDILGYSNLLTKCKSAEEENAYLFKIRKIMADLAQHIEKWNQSVDSRSNLGLSRFKSLLFSDNILFFAPYEDEIDMGNLYVNLLYALSAFITQYVKEDIFFRGGITKGLLFYDEQLHFVFGSGLVQAHYLESEIAKQPRIVIDKDLNPSDLLVGITYDDEGVWYLDYLSLGYCLMQQNDTTQRDYFINCLSEQKEAITTALNKYNNKENAGIHSKYRWLADYHNDFCKENKFDNLLVLKEEFFSADS